MSRLPVKLGIVRAVTSHGDHWTMAPVLTHGIAEALLNPYRVSVYESTTNYDDWAVMRNAVRYGNIDKPPRTNR